MDGSTPPPPPPRQAWVGRAGGAPGGPRGSPGVKNTTRRMNRLEFSGAFEYNEHGVVSILTRDTRLGSCPYPQVGTSSEWLHLRPSPALDGRRRRWPGLVGVGGQLRLGPRRPGTGPGRTAAGSVHRKRSRPGSGPGPCRPKRPPPRQLLRHRDNRPSSGKPPFTRTRSVFRRSPQILLRSYTVLVFYRIRGPERLVLRSVPRAPAQFNNLTRSV